MTLPNFIHAKKNILTYKYCDTIVLDLYHIQVIHYILKWVFEIK